MEHGTKVLRTKDGDKIIFPKVRRTRSWPSDSWSRKAIESAYKTVKADTSTTKPISSGSVMILLSSLTSGVQKMKQCVDYCLAVLVFESFRTLKEIINKCITDIGSRKDLVKQVESVCDFLKYGYSLHIEMDNEVFHDSR